MFDLDLRQSLMAGGAALLVLVVVLYFLKSLFTGGKRKGRVKKQANLQENLADYPDPPPLRRGPRLWVEGVPARLRLIVVAPTGTQHEAIDVDQVPALFDSLTRGLAQCIEADKPRIRTWPPQLSAKGFTPTFFRLVESPDADGDDSPWIRMAGLAKIRGKPYLIGLALYTDDDTAVGALALEANDWVRYLRIEK